MPKILPALAGVSRFSVGKLLPKPALLACASVALMAVAPASSEPTCNDRQPPHFRGISRDDLCG